jgi:hypothetical protein
VAPILPEILTYVPESHALITSVAKLMYISVLSLDFVYLFMFLTTLSVAQTLVSNYRTIVNNELERMWKEATVV